MKLRFNFQVIFLSRLSNLDVLKGNPFGFRVLSLFRRRFWEPYLNFAGKTCWPACICLDDDKFTSKTLRSP